MVSPLRIAAIGLGWVGVHRHLPALRANKAFDLVGVVDRHGERARAVAERLGLRRHHAGDRLADIPWLEEGAPSPRGGRAIRPSRLACR